jgi:phosphoenolpyruvate-protein phosphotransferase (PTS system enzyme I)
MVDPKAHLQGYHQPTVLRGVAASPGIGIGKVYLLKEEALSYEHRTLQRDEVRGEIQRFRTAVNKTRTEIRQTRERVLKVLGKSHAALIDVHLLILDDPMFKDVEKKIAQELINPEGALVASLNHVGGAFDQLGDEYFRERKDDVMDVGRHVMRHLLGHQNVQLAHLKERAIIVSHNLAPSETLSMRDDLVEAFVTDIGGRTSHTAILAQGLEIPAVVALKDVTSHVKNGDLLIVDGTEGIVIINPSAATLETYRKEREIQMAQTRELDKIKDLPAQTRDGRRIVLAANIESHDEVKMALSHGAEGIGLYRTEFLYLNRDELPSEEEHYENYAGVARQMLPYSVIIRTIDLGGDKLAPLGLTGFDREPNPFLGLRGIRLCLRFPELFKTQLRAILRASVQGKLKIMYPMINSIEEVRQANRILEEVREELRRARVPFDTKLEVGIMVETPAAAMISDALAREADFLSLGTNDLIQYTLAVDRVNENVASLYNPLHLSILRLILMVIQAGQKAGKWVGMCGEMAGDTAFTKILLGLGLDEMSVPAAAVPRIKSLVRSTDLQDAQNLAKEIMQLTDQEEIEKRLAPHKL